MPRGACRVQRIICVLGIPFTVPGLVVGAFSPLNLLFGPSAVFVFT